MPEHKMKGDELLSMLKSSVPAEKSSATDDEALHLSEEDMKWWQDAKLGLFVHWGVYSVIGRGEWAYYNEQIAPDSYRKNAEEDFHPSRPAQDITDSWLSLAKDAGMKYAVMVTRHHDGFAMWDSASSRDGFTSVKCGPKADYVRAFTDSCKSYGLHTGLYYSPMDWRFEGYFDPKEHPESALEMKEQAYSQLYELCSDYGRVEILWYDGGWLNHQGSDADAAWLWEPVKLNHMVKSLQPKIIVNPRSGYVGDFSCEEGAYPVTGKIRKAPWEKCMSVASSWGYIKDDYVYPGEYLIRQLVDTASRGGNLLLNISPDGEGNIPDAVKGSLGVLGEWVRQNGESIYGTRGGIWEPIDGVCGSTYRDDTVYLHILDAEKFKSVKLPTPKKRIVSSELLSGGRVDFKSDEDGVIFELPCGVTNDIVPDIIVKIQLG
ncbi:MAG: alpha-L-fucosidase [Firmicutes bacterium]|nr:alpha-L-fucosidase [Bacillota bacterium]